MIDNRYPSIHYITMKDSKNVNLTRTEALMLQSLLIGKTKEKIIQERGITLSTWYTQAGAIRDKLSVGWRDDAPITPPAPTMIQNIQMEIEALVKDGRNLLVSEDIISSRMLMVQIRERRNCYPCDAQVSQALSRHGYCAVGRVLVGGTRHYIWAKPGIDRNIAAGMVYSRFLPKKDQS